MDMATMCAYPSPKYALPHWKFILNCYAQFPCIDIICLESYQHNSNFRSKIRFHVYYMIAQSTVHVRCPLNKKKQFQLCEAYTDSVVTSKMYTIKELILMDT